MTLLPSELSREEVVGQLRLENFKVTVLREQLEWTTRTRYAEMVLRLKKVELWRAKTSKL